MIYTLPGSRYDEIVVNLRHGRNERWPPCRDRRNERLPVPAVDGTVVARLATRLEEKILAQVVASAESVIQIEAGARHVKAQVPSQRRLRRLGLEETR